MFLGLAELYVFSEKRMSILDLPQSANFNGEHRSSGQCLASSFILLEVSKDLLRAPKALRKESEQAP